MKEGTLFLEQALKSKSIQVASLATPTFYEPKMDSETARDSNWSIFKESINPFDSLYSNYTNLDYLFVPKNNTWGSKDMTIFVGSENETINEISDLSLNAFTEFLHLNISLARNLSIEAHTPVQINIGFNPNDFSTGHHSISKLHSQLRMITDSDIKRREQRPWRDFPWFQRLAFIEPFSSIYHEFILSKLDEGLFKKSLMSEPEANLGFTSFLLDTKSEQPSIFVDIYTLYNDMKAEYGKLEDIFTNKLIDSTTNRYLPRSPKERHARLARYLTQNTFLSSASKELLQYLAQNIKVAAPRKSGKDIQNAAMAYITKGFAGGFTFTVGEDIDGMRLDFLPRVITTSAVTKTMLGKKKPTFIEKDSNPATDEDKAAMTLYHNLISQQLTQLRLKAPWD